MADVDDGSFRGQIRLIPSCDKFRGRVERFKRTVAKRPLDAANPNTDKKCANRAFFEELLMSFLPSHGLATEKMENLS